MDREIPKEEQKRRKLKTVLRIAAVTVVALVAVTIVTQMAGSKIDAKSLEFSTVDRGDLQVSVTASASIVPEYQEILVSPISTRIVEVYKRAGDTVDEGTPLLKLDLQTAQTDYRKGLDDEQMRQKKLQQLGVNQNTTLTDLRMKIRVSQMNLNSKRMELRNERYLDSIGSGTTDRVRQAELDYKTAELQLEQLKQQYQNEVKAAKAEREVQQLDIAMFRKTLAETRRTLEDAKIRAPRRAVLTYINSSIGAQIAQGEQVAIVSDLSSFKAECSIADGYSDRLAVGGRVLVHTGGKELTGIVSSVNPQAKDGVIDFTVRFDDSSSKLLRSGLKVEVYVLTSDKANVLRIKNAAFYQGPGTYHLFVRDGNSLVARDVKLGDASYDYIEVESGLSIGDEVVVSDMEKYKGKTQLGIRN